MSKRSLVAAIALVLLPSFAIAAPMTPKTAPAATNSAKPEKVKIAKHHHVIKKAKPKPATTRL